MNQEGSIWQDDQEDDKEEERRGLVKPHFEKWRVVTVLQHSTSRNQWNLERRTFNYRDQFGILRTHVTLSADHQTIIRQTADRGERIHYIAVLYSVRDIELLSPLSCMKFKSYNDITLLHTFC